MINFESTFGPIHTHKSNVLNKLESTTFILVLMVLGILLVYFKSWFLKTIVSTPTSSHLCVSFKKKLKYSLSKNDLYQVL